MVELLEKLSYGVEGLRLESRFGHLATELAYNNTSE